MKSKDKSKKLRSAELEIRAPAGFPSANTNPYHLEKMEDKTRITNNLLQLFHSATSRKEYLDAAVEILRDCSGCRCAGIRVVDSRGHIPYESSVGFSPEFIEIENKLCIEEPSCACMRIVTGRHQPHGPDLLTASGSFKCDNYIKFMNELKDDEKQQFLGHCVGCGLVSIAIVPVRYKDNIIGIIHLADESEGKIPLDLMEFVESLIPIIAEAIHRFSVEDDLRALSSELSLAEERERKHLAAALHDSVGQALSLSMLKLGEIDRFLSGSESKAVLKDVRDIFEKALQQIRTLTFELSPPILYELGLSAAIEWLTEQFERQYCVHFDFEAGGDSKEIPEAVSVLIFQSVRELLINVGKHAKANRVHVSVCANDGGVNVVVKDDGDGFDTASIQNLAHEKHSFGLFSIRERMKYIDGTLKVESTPGKGTTIELSVPLKGNGEG